MGQKDHDVVPDLAGKGGEAGGVLAPRGTGMAWTRVASWEAEDSRWAQEAPCRWTHRT